MTPVILPPVSAVVERFSVSDFDGTASPTTPLVVEAFKGERIIGQIIINQPYGRINFTHDGHGTWHSETVSDFVVPPVETPEPPTQIDLSGVVSGLCARILDLEVSHEHIKAELAAAPVPPPVVPLSHAEMKALYDSLSA
jgi:hypothetical protein